MGQDGLAPGQVAAEDGGADGIEDAVLGAGDDAFGKVVKAEIESEPGKVFGGTHGRTAQGKECKREVILGSVMLGLSITIPSRDPKGAALNHISAHCQDQLPRAPGAFTSTWDRRRPHSLPW